VSCPQLESQAESPRKTQPGGGRPASAKHLKKKRPSSGRKKTPQLQPLPAAALAGADQKNNSSSSSSACFAFDEDDFIDQGPGWIDAGDRAVAIEFVVTCYSRVIELGGKNLCLQFIVANMYDLCSEILLVSSALCTDVIGWFFNDQERRSLQQRLGKSTTHPLLQPCMIYALTISV
jgi:hypothetical protein